MLDFAAYLRRIGLSERATFAEIHRAHATSIPFENLDPHRGIPVSLEPAELERKLVRERRGGYCFEHNLLLASALEHIGLGVELMLARVRAGAPPGAVRPRGHLLLRVTDEAGAVWHADVGFGPAPAAEYRQSGWSFRVVEEGSELVLQTRAGAEWFDVYAFEPQPVPRVDVETSNWWTCTNPSSPFVFGLIAAVNRSDGTRELVSDWSGPLVLIVQSPAGTDVSELPREAIGELLAERFGLPGFALGADGRLATIG